MKTNAALRLGLIGDNISRSRSPALHRAAGLQNNVAVSYDRLIPKEMGLTFEEVFNFCQTSGYRGINITYPYKEMAAKLVTIDDPLVREIGAVNTVIFRPEGPYGSNTDYSGFVAAFRGVLGDREPGIVLMIGTGGVGRAIAFGLVALGVKGLRLVDRQPEKAEALADALNRAAPGLDISIWVDAEKAATGADGLVNCTPVGMVGYEGTPIARSAMHGASWAFDAVYTPVETQFLGDASREGLTIISGYELFFFQGVHAWGHFAGLPLDESRLRSQLVELDPTG